MVKDIIAENPETEVETEIEPEEIITTRDRILYSMKWIKEGDTIFDDDFKHLVVDVTDKYVNFAQSMIGKANRKAFLQEVFNYFGARDPNTKKFFTEMVTEFLEKHQFEAIKKKRKSFLNMKKNKDREIKNQLFESLRSYKDEIRLSNKDGYKILFESGGILLKQASWKRIQFHIDSFNKELDDETYVRFVVDKLNTAKASEKNTKDKAKLGQKTGYQKKLDQLKETQKYFNEAYRQLPLEARTQVFMILKRIEEVNKTLQKINNAEEHKDIYYRNTIFHDENETKLVLALLQASLRVEEKIGDEMDKIRMNFIAEKEKNFNRLKNKIEEISYVFSGYDFGNFMMFWDYVFDDDMLALLNNEDFPELKADELVLKIRESYKKELMEEYDTSKAEILANEFVDREQLYNFYEIYNQFDERVKSNLREEFEEGHLFIELYEIIRFSANELKGKIDTKHYEKSFNDFKENIGFPDSFSGENVNRLATAVLNLYNFIERVEDKTQEEVVEQDQEYFQRDEDDDDADEDIKEMKKKKESKKITVEFFYEAEHKRDYEVIEIEMDLYHTAKSYFNSFATKIEKKYNGLDFYFNQDKLEILPKDKVIDLHLKNGSKITATKKDLFEEDDEEEVEIVVRLPLRYNVRSDEEYLQDLDRYASKVFKINDLEKLGRMKRKVYREIEKQGIVRDKERIKYEICQSLYNTFKIIKMVISNQS